MPWSSIVRKATLDMKYLAAVEALPEETPADALAAEYLVAVAALYGTTPKLKTAPPAPDQVVAPPAATDVVAPPEGGCQPKE